MSRRERAAEAAWDVVGLVLATAGMLAAEAAGWAMDRRRGAEPLGGAPHPSQRSSAPQGSPILARLFAACARTRREVTQ